MPVLMTNDVTKICDYLNRLTDTNKEWIFGINHPKFEIAKEHVTNSDIKFIKDLIRLSAEKEVSEHEARIMTAKIRWDNRICNECRDKSDILKLFFCDKCYLVQYCSEECQEHNLLQHQKKCCNPEGPLDDGPQQFAIIKKIISYYLGDFKIF